MVWPDKKILKKSDKIWQKDFELEKRHRLDGESNRDLPLRNMIITLLCHGKHTLDEMLLEFILKPMV